MQPRQIAQSFENSKVLHEALGQIASTDKPSKLHRPCKPRPRAQPPTQIMFAFSPLLRQRRDELFRLPYLKHLLSPTIASVVISTAHNTINFNQIFNTNPFKSLLKPLFCSGYTTTPTENQPMVRSEQSMVGLMHLLTKFTKQFVVCAI